MERLTNVKISRILLIACFTAYLVNTTVKMCVPTVISSMVSESFLSKSQSGLLSGIFYLVYGVGQLVFGKYFNNHSPYIGIKVALLGSVFCCLLMSLTDSFYLLLIIWSLCAVINACFFPAIMKIVSFVLVGKHSIWANKYLSIAYQAGTVLCLLAGSIIIKYIGWVKLYYFAAVISLISFAYWLLAEYLAKQSTDEAHYIVIGDTAARETEKRPIKSYFGTGIFCIFAISFFNNLLNGVKSWSPTIIMETYNTSSSFSVFLNVIIVASNILFLLIMGKYILHNKVKSVLIFYSVALPMIILLNFTEILNEYTYVLLLGGLTSVSSFANNVAAIQIPFYFDKYNDVSRISGISNMCASFALLVGNYAYGVLADAFGWQIIMILCTVFVVACIVLAMVASPRFNRFIRSQ